MIFVMLCYSDSHKRGVVGLGLSLVREIFNRYSLVLGKIFKLDGFLVSSVPTKAVKFEYFPEHQGIPVKYFPYKGKSQPYHAPLVAVRVTQHNEDHWGELLHIECRAWYDGVHHDTKEKSGLVQFEVQLVPTDKSLAESLPGYV